MPDPIRFSPAGPEGWLAAPDQPLEHAELIKGSPVGLDHAYLDVDESGSVPSVNRVDLYGFALADGKPVKESFKPW